MNVIFLNYYSLFKKLKQKIPTQDSRFIIAIFISISLYFSIFLIWLEWYINLLNLYILFVTKEKKNAAFTALIQIFSEIRISWSLVGRCDSPLFKSVDIQVLDQPFWVFLCFCWHLSQWALRRNRYPTANQLKFEKGEEDLPLRLQEYFKAEALELNYSIGSLSL